MGKMRMPSGDYVKKLVLLPPDILDKLEKEAAKEHRSVNGQLVHTLAQALKTSQARRQTASA